jgi:hypothetical protein
VHKQKRIQTQHMKLSDIPHPILLDNVFSYLTLPELIQVYSLNHYWRNAIDTHTNLFLGSINHSLNELTSQEKNKSQYLALVDDSVPMSEVLQAFNEPLRLIPVTEHNYALRAALGHYNDCGGVLVHGSFELHPVFDAIFKECGPLEIFHRLAMVLAVLYNDIDDLNRFNTEPCHNFDFKKGNGKIKKINQGQLLQELLRCDYETVQQVDDISLHKMPVHARAHKAIPDIMAAIHDPPYGIRNNLKLSDPTVTTIKKDLFDNYKLSGYSWIDERSDWSSFFDAGKEWWGIYAYTMYNRKSSSLVVALASSTD